MSSRPGESRLILVRHAPVADRYSGLCYGQSDVELGPLGEAQSIELAQSLARLPVQRVIHSGLQRTRFLAKQLGALLGIEPECSEAVRERHFGSWELQKWDEIYDQTGDEMLGMMTDPVAYRPGGGETTREMQSRVIDYLGSLPQLGVIVVVTHGGPIAAVLGTIKQVPVSDWPDLIPACGECTTIECTSGAKNGFGIKR